MRLSFDDLTGPGRMRRLRMAFFTKADRASAGTARIGAQCVYRPQVYGAPLFAPRPKPGPAAPDLKYPLKPLLVMDA